MSAKYNAVAVLDSLFPKPVEFAEEGEYNTGRSGLPVKVKKVKGARDSAVHVQLAGNVDHWDAGQLAVFFTELAKRLPVPSY